jgi:bacterioferritin-associated ferredoxin
MRRLPLHIAFMHHRIPAAATEHCGCYSTHRHTQYTAENSEIHKVLEDVCNTSAQLEQPISTSACCWECPGSARAHTVFAELAPQVPASGSKSHATCHLVLGGFAVTNLWYGPWESTLQVPCSFVGGSAPVDGTAVA